MDDDPLNIGELGMLGAIIYSTGCIVSWWGRVEFLMTMELQRLLAHPALADDKEFAVIQIASKRRIKQWVRAHKIVHADRPNIVRAAEAIASEARDLLDDRNVLIHGMWNPYGDPNDPVTVTHLEPPKKGAWIMKTYTVTADSANEINTRCWKLYDRLVELSLNSAVSFGGSLNWSIKSAAD